MSLNTTAKYAINALDFMVNSINQKYSVRELSDALNIPYKYLTKIMTELAKKEIVSSNRGKYGGFFISCDIKKIRLIDVVVIFDDATNDICIISEKKCNFREKCTLHDKWQKPKCFIDDFYTKTTLFDLIN